MKHIIEARVIIEDPGNNENNSIREIEYEAKRAARDTIKKAVDIFAEDYNETDEMHMSFQRKDRKATIEIRSYKEGDPLEGANWESLRINAC